jgi:holo-[acyl-carrier protein] synthase
MIFGIGVDISTLAEVSLSVEEFGIVLFAEQYCTNNEINYISTCKNPNLSLAKHLALKEAVSKAFGTGLIDEFWFNDIEIQFSESGYPKIFVSQESVSFLENEIVKSTFGIHASVSSCIEFASATSIVIRN